MEYKSYMHIERLGREEVEGILNGVCYIMPKIDGTNGVLFLDNNGSLSAGSRRRQLNLENNEDNHGFAKEMINDKKIEKYLKDHPNHYLYGEWLVKHTIGYYHPDAWRKFYIFDVFDAERDKYIPYEEYVKELEKYEIENIIPLLAKIENPNEEDLVALINSNHYLMDEDKMGEGIVIKNYDFVNPYGRTTFAKIVAKEFFDNKKENSQRNHETKMSGDLSMEIVNNFLTDEMIEKEYQKILQDLKPAENRNKFIGLFLNRVWHEFLIEEIAAIDKKYKHPTINFRELRFEVESRIKSFKKELF